MDDARERTITTIGPKIGPRGHDDSLPWHELARCDAVYFCAGDVDALVHARGVAGREVPQRQDDAIRPKDAPARERDGRRVECARFAVHLLEGHVRRQFAARVLEDRFEVPAVKRAREARFVQ